MTPNYKAFALEIIQEALQGSDWDGGSIQDLAVKHRILKRVKYDPKVHGPNDIDVEPGDEWFILTEE